MMTNEDFGPTRFYLQVGVTSRGPFKSYGPFDTRTEAFKEAEPFVQEGHYVELTTSVLMCDFCSDLDVKWSYEASSFVMPESGSAFHGGWAACDPCHDLIEADKRQQLAKRSVDTFFKNNPDVKDVPAVRVAIAKHVRAAHAGFFAVKGKVHRGMDAL